ncbi:MAG: hypothetical protein KGR26_16720 [Cyanobacteria bacterium REEB65]|nr:hypothetical protein [Cyanobacteria bacterium REEB65]
MPMTLVEKRRAGRFQAWKKRAGLNSDAFARAVPLSFLTVKKYDRGAMPRAAIQSLIRPKFPDCPLLPENGA